MTNLQKMIDLSIRENALIISEIEKRLNTFLGYEGPPELAPPFIGKQPPEVEALLTKRTALLTKQMALLTKQAGLERRRAELERNRPQKQDCAGEDRASYLITVISDANLTPVSSSFSKPSTAFIR